MKILVTGSGGREHALVKKLLQNPIVEKIYCAPGNGGTALEKGCENIALTDINSLADFASKKAVDLALPGSEDMLVAGIADLLKEKGIPVLGPHRAAALLEGSKCLAKDFMKKYSIKTAAYENFSSIDKAEKYLESCDFPIVLKADGLAAGKGVLICQNRDEAFKALKTLMSDKKFGTAGDNIVIEEFLEGIEASILSFYDGKTILPLLSAKDHKKIAEGESGPNTGGMGVISPNPYVSENVMTMFKNEIMEPTIRGLAEEGLQFAGIIFFGLMINKKGIYLLEYNLRMGDPETQAVLALLDSDLLEIIQASLNGTLKDCKPVWKEGSSCCVVMASGGYPEAYEKNKVIKGIENCTSSNVYIAGACLKDDELLTSGGRVLNVVSTAADLETARKNCYKDVSKISFHNAVYRRDIGGKIIS